MITPKYTPGPWGVESEYVRAGKHLTIADCCPDCGSRVRMDETWQANARLIAAAPDLLAALNVTVARLDYVTRNDDFTTAVHDALEQGRAAIAKATQQI